MKHSDKENLGDKRLVELIYEWLMKFNLGDAFTLNEARNKATRIKELFKN